MQNKKRNTLNPLYLSAFRDIMILEHCYRNINFKKYFKKTFLSQFGQREFYGTLPMLELVWRLS